MRPDQCHGEPKPTEIIPDTSKYTDLPNKLRAFIAAIESGGELEVMIVQSRGWEPIMPATDLQRLESLSRGNQYRAKPKPRELWMIEFEDGSFGHHWESEKEARVGMPASTKVVRFVEQP